MDVAAFSIKPYDRTFLGAANAEADGPGPEREPGRHRIVFFETRLTRETAALAKGRMCVCAFVNDRLDREVLEILAEGGTRLVALRCAGFNNVDLEAAQALGIAICRVPAYSPDAIAEHAVALMLTLNRRIHKAYARVREGNFALDGLLGFDMRGKVAGVVGTGQIGLNVARILTGFGCRVMAFDPSPSAQALALGVEFTNFEALLEACDIVTLHCPLTPATHHLIDDAAVARMKSGAMLVNTSRGAVMDSRAVIEGLKSGKIGHVALDVYEEEGDLFFENLSDRVIRDDVFVRLMTFPNVLVTGHQGFFTHEAMAAIAQTTLANIDAFEQHGRPLHPVLTDRRA